MLVVSINSIQYSTFITISIANPSLPRGYQVGDTPLHYSTQCGKTETAEMLISHGAQANVKNNVRAIRLRASL